MPQLWGSTRGFGMPPVPVPPPPPVGLSDGAGTGVDLAFTTTVGINCAAATTQGGLVCTTEFNQVTTSAAGSGASGVTAYSPGGGGRAFIVYNATVNDIRVWPQVGGAFGSYGTNNPVLLLAGTSTRFTSNDANLWAMV